MLQLDHVTKRYRGIPAVWNVSFAIKEGDVLGYLGPNGSGKSTTVKMIIGMIQPTKGKIFFAGRNIHDDLATYRTHLGYVPEEAQVYTHLSGLEYLQLIGRLRGIVPIAACIDTCHTHVAGYDIVTREGIDQTLLHLDATVGLNHVRVIHCNDAKAARGSKLDRHQHVGKGTIGLEPFRILLNDLRIAHAAFIAETPIDKPGDDRRNVETLKKLVAP